MRQEFRNGLAEQLWLRPLMRSQSDANWVCSHLKVWGKSSKVAHSRLASWYWQFVGGLSFVSCGPLHRTAWVSSWHGDWLPPEWAVKDTKEKSCNAFRQVLEVTHHHFHHTLSVTKTSPDSQGCVYQVEITVGIFGSCLPHSVCWSSPFFGFILFYIIYSGDLSTSLYKKTSSFLIQVHNIPFQDIL